MDYDLVFGWGSLINQHQKKGFCDMPRAGVGSVERKNRRTLNEKVFRGIDYFIMNDGKE